MSYSPYYTGGWQTGETGGTPITPAALNHMDSGIGANAAAAAEQAEDISDVNALLGNTSMGTTATTVTGAIKEHSNKIGNTSMGTTAQTLTGAIAEHESDISALNGNLAVGEYTATAETGATGSIYQIVKFGRIVVVSFYIATTQAFAKNATLATLPSAITNYSKGTWAIGATESNAVYRVSIAASSNIIKADMAIPSGVGFFGQLVYITAS